MGRLIIFALIAILALTTSCESNAEHQKRLALEEQQRMELEEKKQKEAVESALRLEEERIAYEARLEEERRQREVYEKYIGNSLRTGETPYRYCYGFNSTCSEWGCSKIEVKTPSNSAVLVTIKKDDEVVGHAFIEASSSYAFELPNGTYQPFFYYGKGWNPEKVMKQATCGTLRGGFVSDEVFGKDQPQKLSNNILEYELILQPSGNFSTQPSNIAEAL